MRLLTSCLAFLVAACAATEPAEPPASGALRADTTLPGALQTTVLSTTPIRVSVAGLPEPFATESARTGASVIALPEDARPVVALVLPDGSLLFTDEANGRIDRVSWVGHG